MRKKGKDEQEEVAKNKNWCVLNDMWHPPNSYSPGRNDEVYLF